MAWHVSGKSVEFCSCKMLCPCWLGPEGEPDQGWCCGTLTFDIQEGNSDGVDLAGTKVAFAAEWPGNFFAGDGTARIYVDAAASDEQRRELEAIFTGKKGGPLEPLFAAVISRWLPTQTVDVSVEWGENPSCTVGDVGSGTLRPIKNPTGEQAVLLASPGQGAFLTERMAVAIGKGSRWSDPDMRDWQGDSATIHEFKWSG